MVWLHGSGPTSCQLCGAVRRLVTLATVGVVDAKGGLPMAEPGWLHGDTWAIMGWGVVVAWCVE